MYWYKNLHFRFSADTCTSTFATANIFPWYLLIRENFANEAVHKLNPRLCFCLIIKTEIYPVTLRIDAFHCAPAQVHLPNALHHIIISERIGPLSVWYSKGFVEPVT